MGNNASNQWKRADIADSSLWRGNIISYGRNQCIIANPNDILQLSSGIYRYNLHAKEMHLIALYPDSWKKPEVNYQIIKIMHDHIQNILNLLLI